MSIKKIEPHVFSQLGFKKTPFLQFFNTGFKVGEIIHFQITHYTLHIHVLKIFSLKDIQY